MDPRQTLEAFDAFLELRGLHFEGIVVGGAALSLLGVIARATKDCDVLDPDIPPGIASAALAFAAARRRSGEILGDDIGDCIALAPTPEELHRLGPWLEERDTHKLWPVHVRATLADLARKLGHAV